MKATIPLTFGLCLLSCAGPTPEAEEQASTAAASQGESTAVSTTPSGACAICNTWEATAVTINGKNDPERDPTGKVEWVIRPDSTFSMWDATEGSDERMEGRWQLQDGKRLMLIGPENEGALPFDVEVLEKERLVLKVMEDAGEAEVLLHFKAK